MRRAVGIVLLLAGCSNAPEEKPAWPDTGLYTSFCEINLAATEPEADASDHYVGDPIVFQLEDPDETATIIAPVPGTIVRSDGVTLTFTPDAPLTPSTAYTFRLEWCDGAVDLSFRTADVGSGPVESALVGRTYAVDLLDGRFNYDDMSGWLLADLGEALLLEVTAQEPGQVDLIAAPTQVSEPVQDYCLATRVIAASFGSDPAFELDLGSSDAAFGRLGLLERASFAGTFAPDGTWFAGGTLEVLLDARAVSRLPVEVCGRSASRCVACADGQPYCLPLVVEGLEGVEASDPIVPIARADCRDCAVGPPLFCD